MKFLVALVACVFAFCAGAAEKTFSWTAPTAYTDGTALPAAQISGYRLTCGATVVPIAGAVTTFKRDFAPGSYSCSLQTIATNGQISAASNTATFTVPQLVPNAATGLSVD